MGVLVGLFHRSPSAWAFVRNLAVAFVPAVVLGLALGDYIELLLGNATVVAWALIIGGIAILIVEKLAKTHEAGGVANVTLKQSVMIGLAQCLAMVPGVSRSGATILGAMSFGVDRKTAADFSFFLAVPTLAATLGDMGRAKDMLAAARAILAGEARHVDVPAAGHCHRQRDRERAPLPFGMKHRLVQLRFDLAKAVHAAHVVHAIHGQPPGLFGNPVPIMESRVTSSASFSSLQPSVPFGRIGSTRKRHCLASPELASPE